MYWLRAASSPVMLRMLTRSHRARSRKLARSGTVLTGPSVVGFLPRPGPGGTRGRRPFWLLRSGTRQGLFRVHHAEPVVGLDEAGPRGRVAELLLVPADPLQQEGPALLLERPGHRAGSPGVSRGERARREEVLPHEAGPQQAPEEPRPSLAHHDVRSPTRQQLQGGNGVGPALWGRPHPRHLETPRLEASHGVGGRVLPGDDEASEPRVRKKRRLRTRSSQSRCPARTAARRSGGRPDPFRRAASEAGRAAVTSSATTVPDPVRSASDALLTRVRTIPSTGVPMVEARPSTAASPFCVMTMFATR